MRKKGRKISVLLFVLLFFAGGGFVLADDPELGGLDETDCEEEGFYWDEEKEECRLTPPSEVSWPTTPFGTSLEADSELHHFFQYLYEWGVGIGGILAFGMLVFAGAQYMASAGNPQKMTEARNRITSALLGLALLLSTFLILNTINPQLTRVRPIDDLLRDLELQMHGVAPGAMEEPPCSFVRLYPETDLEGWNDEWDEVVPVYPTQVWHNDHIDEATDVDHAGIFLDTLNPLKIPNDPAEYVETLSFDNDLIEISVKHRLYADQRRGEELPDNIGLPIYAPQFNWSFEENIHSMAGYRRLTMDEIADYHVPKVPEMEGYDDEECEEEGFYWDGSNCYMEEKYDGDTIEKGGLRFKEETGDGRKILILNETEKDGDYMPYIQGGSCMVTPSEHTSSFWGGTKRCDEDLGTIHVSAKGVRDRDEFQRSMYPDTKHDDVDCLHVENVGEGAPAPIDEMIGEGHPAYGTAIAIRFQGTEGTDYERDCPEGERELDDSLCVVSGMAAKDQDGYENKYEYAEANDYNPEYVTCCADEDVF